jgi:hypothetical protein
MGLLSIGNIKRCPKVTTKDDIIKRRLDLLDQLNNDTFNREKFLKKHKILDRTLRRDLNELAESGQLFEDKLSFLRKKCLGKLTKLANDNELSPSMLFNIVMSGVTKKSDVDINLTGVDEGVTKLIEISRTTISPES